MVAEDCFEIKRSLPHGNVTAVAAMANKLKLPALLGPSCRGRDIIYALIIARAIRPASKLTTSRWFSDTCIFPPNVPPILAEVCHPLTGCETDCLQCISDGSRMGSFRWIVSTVKFKSFSPWIAVFSVEKVIQPTSKMLRTLSGLTDDDGHLLALTA